MNEFEIPENLRSIANAAINHAINGTELPEDIDDLIDWFESDGRDYLVSSWDEDDYVLNISNYSQYNFSDQELVSHEGFDGDIDNRHRVDYALELLSTVFDELDGGEVPTLHPVQITSPSGDTATLGWLMEIHGQGGPEDIFIGVFPDKLQFYNHLRGLGYLFKSDLEKLSEDRILSLWQ